eukprot:5412689-Pleurochrysis_carterae.AAC.1
MPTSITAMTTTTNNIFFTMHSVAITLTHSSPDRFLSRLPIRLRAAISYRTLRGDAEKRARRGMSAMPSATPSVMSSKIPGALPGAITSVLPAPCRYDAYSQRRVMPS